ncbi:hypothetical protein [Halorussus salinus]|uniref:hypothetical protein n=1 Tax=Halorussus salinus TaxID=1364935 RepID=UPI001092DC5E|nr:hypothetical protein [Halorussus salinus]
MYKRKSNSGHEIEWEPENEEAAAKALAEVEGTGVASEPEAKERTPDLGDDHELAQRVQERYQKRVEQADSSK